MPRTIRLAVPLCLGLVLTTLALSSVSCAPAHDDSALRAELRTLSTALEETRDELSGLRREVERQEHRLDSLASRPRVSTPTSNTVPSVESPTTAAGGGSADAPTAAASDPAEIDAPTTEVITRVLQSEAGRQAIQAVAQEINRQQRTRETDTMVSYELSRFAQDAGLDPHQTTELRRTWTDVMEKARAMTEKMRDFANLSAEEQQQVREEMRGGMRALAEERTSRVRSILNDEQYELYLERQKDIDASLHGAPRSRPARADGEGRPAR